MELRQLRYFIAVAEELHFGHAAERLQMTRSPLSQQIQALERELGVELFVRGRRIELTEAGQAFLEQARAATQAADHAVRAAREVGDGSTRLRLGYPAMIASWYASLAIRMFRERFPAIILETKVGHSGAHLTALHARQLDVAFVFLDRRAQAGAFRPLYCEHLLVAMPHKHPLARLQAIRVEQLAREPVVLLPRSLDPPLHDHLVLDVYGRAGIKPTVVLEATTLESNLGAVAAGLGLAFTAESAVDLFAAKGITFRPLVTRVPDLQVGVAWRRDPTSRAVQQLLAVLDELAGVRDLARRNGSVERSYMERIGISSGNG